MSGASGTSPIGREVVLGARSKVWQGLARDARIAQRFQVAIGHDELPRFTFRADDRVWVFAYSRRRYENSAMLQLLQRAGVSEVVYVSSASAIVTELTGCYRYPTVKRQAETEARTRLDARILVLGIVYESPAELPGGMNAVTALHTLAHFMLAPRWPATNVVNLFELLRTAFPRPWEERLHRRYSALQWLLRRYPCILRPLDFALRAAGIRWYGYVNLSNRLWSSTK